MDGKYNILNPENIKTLVENADVLKSVLSSGDEAAAIEDNDCDKCCCPKLIKFKILFSNVWIENKNAECKR